MNKDCPDNRISFDVKSKQCIACKVRCQLREEFIKKSKNEKVLEDVSDVYMKYEGKAILG